MQGGDFSNINTWKLEDLFNFLVDNKWSISIRKKVATEIE
jgi:hypothetical protein